MASERSSSVDHDVDKVETVRASYEASPPTEVVAIATTSLEQHDHPQNNADSSAASADDHFSIEMSADSTDGDSAIEDLYPPASTESLRSSIYDYVEENGRTYHRYKSGNYMLPNDELEQERLDLQHQLWLFTLKDKLFLAPISNPQRVLDVGTGTGIWAIEFATQTPSADVLGVDLSPIQPAYVPPNCRFEVDDAEDEWIFSYKFDFIHGRLLFSCFKDPREVIQQAYNSLAPGGYLEMQELYGQVQCIDESLAGTALEHWNEKLVLAAKAIHRDLLCASKFKQYFADAGFEDIVETRFAWPINSWPRRKEDKILGLYHMTNMLDGIHGMSSRAMTKGLGMTTQEVELLLVDVRKDLKTRSIHGYYPILVIYGRKPL